MSIVKVGLIVAVATAGIGPVSVSVTRVEREPANAVQYGSHEQVVQKADIDYPVGTLPELRAG
jgi:hypothetical protein